MSAPDQIPVPQGADTADQVIIEAERHLGEKPRILVCGRTGAGKSSLINALLDRQVNRVGHCEPTTQQEQEEAFTVGCGSMRILDVPGFGEAGKHKDRLDFIFSQLPAAHLGLLVVGAPDRAWEQEQDFVRQISEADSEFPLLVAANRIDMLSPVRDWSPANLNLEHPATPKEQAIVMWRDALREALGSAGNRLYLTSAGESFADRDGRYGITELRQAIVSALPAAVQHAAARALKVDTDKRALADRLIWGAAVAASAVALAPIPFADCIPLAGIQAGLIIKIAALYGKVMSRQTACNLLAPAAASVAGRGLAANLIKLVPGGGTVAGALIGAGVAGPLTYAIGKTYLEFFARHNFRPNQHEVEQLLQKQYQKAKTQRAKFEAQARTQRCSTQTPTK